MQYLTWVDNLFDLSGFSDIACGELLKTFAFFFYILKSCGAVRAGKGFHLEVNEEAQYPACCPQIVPDKAWSDSIHHKRSSFWNGRNKRTKQIMNWNNRWISMPMSMLWLKRIWIDYAFYGAHHIVNSISRNWNYYIIKNLSKLQK